MRLSERVKRIKPSPTLAITAKAQSMRAAGRNIINFGAGEPDFDTPDDIKKAAILAIEAGFTKYTPVGGIEELKDAVVAKLKRDNGLEYGRSNVFVSCGAKHTLFNLAQVLFEAGDEVIIPAPYWVSYPDIVVLSGATPVVVSTTEEDGFKLKADDLARAVTSKTKAVIINSPSNPTGMAYSEADLKALAEVVLEKDLTVISDDIYEKIAYEGFRFINIAMTGKEIKDRTIVVNGVSKTYSMTGWRIGYAAGPQDVISAATDYQSQNTSNPTSISQKAAVAALNGDQTPVAKMVKEFQKRRDYTVDALNGIKGVRCMKPQGAFYAFPNTAGLYGKSFKGRRVDGSVGLAAYLLDEAEVAVVPGDPFGNDDHIRLSFATSMKNIEEGLKRIRQALEG
ncbi:MAG: pyridoxal phosphate-dependent aminotransferase [Syntrophobacterales bacterium]|nr:pyridoxal phosphate-dependent aminotransferase [Syntrophobacterales bacterium]